LSKWFAVKGCFVAFLRLLDRPLDASTVRQGDETCIAARNQPESQLKSRSAAQTKPGTPNRTGHPLVSWQFLAIFCHFWP
jgi:hypothetical protein